MSDRFSLIQECSDSYEAATQPDGSLEIRIKVPRRFADLWLVKLSGLSTTMEEIEEYEPEEDE